LGPELDPKKGKGYPSVAWLRPWLVFPVPYDNPVIKMRTLILIKRDGIEHRFVQLIFPIEINNLC
jgi:hypothetical protein